MLPPHQREKSMKRRIESNKDDVLHNKSLPSSLISESIYWAPSCPLGRFNYATKFDEVRQPPR